MMDRSADPAAIDRPDPQQAPPADAPHAHVLPLSILYVPGLAASITKGKPPPPRDAAFSAQTSRGGDALKGGGRGRGGDIYFVLTSVYAEAMHAHARARAR